MKTILSNPINRQFELVLCVLFAAVTLNACASAKFVSTGKLYPAKPKDCEIEVFSSKLPDRDYEELGILEGEGSLGKDSLTDVLPKMKEKACQAGGDAIILFSSHKSVDVSGLDDIVGSDDKLNVVATVVRWTD